MKINTKNNARIMIYSHGFHQYLVNIYHLHHKKSLNSYQRLKANTYLKRKKAIINIQVKNTERIKIS